MWPEPLPLTFPDWIRWRVVAPPAAEPATLQQFKDHLRFSGDASQDSLLADCLQAAREWVERHCRLCLMPQTILVTLDRFPPGQIPLPRGPARSVTLFQIRRADGTWRVLSEGSDFQFQADGNPPSLWGQPNGFWPWSQWAQAQPLGRLGNAEVTYEAGFADGTLPAGLRRAVLILAGMLFENPDSGDSGEMPFGVSNLLRLYSTGGYR